MNCSIPQYNNELYSVQRLNVQSYKDQSDHHTLALQKWKKIFSEKMEETFLKSLKLFLSLETVFSPSNYHFKTEIQVLDLHVRRAFPSPSFFYVLYTYHCRNAPPTHPKSPSNQARWLHHPLFLIFICINVAANSRVILDRICSCKWSLPEK